MARWSVLDDGTTVVGGDLVQWLALGLRLARASFAAEGRSVPDDVANLAEAVDVAARFRLMNPGGSEVDGFGSSGGWMPALDAAARLEVSPSRVCRLARDGRLAGRKVAGAWLLSETSVESYAKARRRAA